MKKLAVEEMMSMVVAETKNMVGVTNCTASGSRGVHRVIVKCDLRVVLPVLQADLGFRGALQCRCSVP